MFLRLKNIFYPTTKNFIALLFGLLFVFFGQVVVILFHILLSSPKKTYSYKKALIAHFSNVEGILLLAIYLSITWLAEWMPCSYYCWNGGIKWHHVLVQLLLQDFLQYIFHRLEHSFVILYQNFHIQHHRYKVPKLFDAFSGSLGDTIIMILIPMWSTSRIVHTNLWSYIAFGAIYSSWLLIIHCEYDFPWDGPCRKFGFGTPREHRAHHKHLKYNYGHLFMFWDYLFGTMHEISKN